MIRRVRCARCGKLVRQDDAHTCSPNTLFPPHAAGEEEALHLVALVERFIAGEYTKFQLVDAIRGLPTVPAASQAVPEMPGYIAQRIRWARDRKIAGAMTAQEEATVWLADRVAELERNEAAWIERHATLLQQRDALQASAAQETKRLETALRKIAKLRYVEDANEPFDEALNLADAALSRPAEGE